MANLKENPVWEDVIYQIDKLDPVLGGEGGVTNRPLLQLANRTFYLKKQIDFAQNLAKPKAITAATTNSVDGTGHTHLIDSATTAKKGIVQLNDTLTSTANDQALTANQGKILNEKINTKLASNANAVSSSKLATPRNIALTGDVSGQTSFDGSANVGIGVTLANSGVQAGTYQSVTVDAKGRVTSGQTVLNSLITATTTTGTTNQATGNTNTYLNLVTRTGTSTHSQGSSTKITGTNGISVSSDTAGALTIAGTRASDTAVGVTQLSHNTNGTDKTKAASEFALGEVRRMANQAQVTADGIALTWGNVQNKPSTFTPSTHRHNWSEIDGKPATFTPSTHSHAWNDITGKPATFEPSTHTHQYISAVDDRDLRNVRVPPRALSLYFMHRNGIRNLASSTKDYGDFLVLNSYSDTTGGKTNALFFSKERNEIIHHQAEVGSGSAWEIGKTLAYKDDNVASASKLQTPRTINGVAFDGTQNIELSAPTIWNGDLRTAEELNNAKKSGFYRVLKNPAISALELYDYGLLYVHKIDDVIQQTYFAHVPNAKGGCATRQTWTGDWNNGNNKWRIIDAPLQNSLTSTATDQALTAAQGKILNETKANISHTHTTQQLTDFNIRGISATENLNDILTSGLYTQVLTANASLSRNYPVANAGTLVVMPSAYGWQQEYTTWDTGEKYVRNRTHQTQNIWSNWLRIDGADWSSLRNKPSTFTPSSHTHSWGEIDGKPSTFTPSQHTHDWNSITGKPTTLVHTTGATFTGSITVPDLITQKLRSSEPVGLLQENNGNAQRLYTGGLLASNVYSDSSLIPENGIFAKGQIRTTSGFVGDLSGNSSTATKLQTPRNIALTGAVTGSVSFDGSQNVSISTQQTIQRVQKSMQIPTTNNFNNTPNVTVTGSVETFVDGRVVQHFTLVCSIFHFYRANAVQLYKDSGFSVNYFGEGGASFLELPLWTAMPNKVQRATINIASVENNFIHEALEWICCWESMWNTSKNIRDKAYFGFRRISGEANEKVQIHITVEGY